MWADGAGPPPSRLGRDAAPSWCGAELSDRFGHPPRPNDTPCELEVHSAHELAVLPVSAWNGAALKRDRGG